MPFMYDKLQPINQTGFDVETITSHVESFKQAGFSAPLMLRDFNDRALAKTPVLVVCPGPSHREEIAKGVTRLDALLEQEPDKKVVLAGSTVLLKNETMASKDVDAVVLSNPTSDYTAALPEAELLKDIPVYIATHCAPKVFEALRERGANIKPYNAYLEVTRNLDSREFCVGTGYGAAVSTIGLMSAFGHRAFDVIGWDGSPFYAKGEELFPEDANVREENSQKVTIDGQDFVVSGDFAGDVPEFINFIRRHSDAVSSLHVHGDTSYNAKLLNDQGGARTSFRKLSL